MGSRIAGWSIRKDRWIPYQGDKKRSTVQEWVIHLPNSQVMALTDQRRLVCIPTSSINMQIQSTGGTMENATSEILEKSKQKKSPTTTFSAEDSLARALALLENVEDLTTQEAQCSLKSLGFSKRKNRDMYYSKMLRVYLVTTKAELSRQSLGFSPTLGMECNGRYLIQKTSEFPKTENGCSLSDILEEDVDPKYFLSSEQTAKILKNLPKDKARG